jgi:putative nucleotide binding protein
MEDYVYILDYLPQGRPDAPPSRREPTLLGIGETQFTLFELVPKPGASFTIGDKAYIGKDVAQRGLVQKIRGRVTYQELTPAAHGELPYVIEDIVRSNPMRFVKFFNDAPAISVRYHALELLPGIGKKSVEHLVAERKKPFESIEDLDARGKVANPMKVIIGRILHELQDPTEKYHIFVRPPAKEDDDRWRGPRRGP